MDGGFRRDITAERPIKMMRNWKRGEREQSEKEKRGGDKNADFDWGCPRNRNVSEAFTVDVGIVSLQIVQVSALFSNEPCR